MTVRIERPAPRVAELVMDRPAALNALSTDQARRLAEAARTLAADPDTSVVVLVSALPDAFCVGADLKERNELDDEGLRAQRAVFVEAFAAVRDMRAADRGRGRGLRAGRRLRARPVLRPDRRRRLRDRRRCPRSVSASSPAAGAPSCCPGGPGGPGPSTWC